MIKKNSKRHKLSNICDNCRRRKVKCDRGRPCFSCVKRKIGHLCGNNTSEEVPNDNHLDSSLEKKKMHLKVSDTHFVVPECMNSGQNCYSEENSHQSTSSTTPTKNCQYSSMAMNIGLMKPLTAGFFVLQMLKDKVKEIETFLGNGIDMEDDTISVEQNNLVSERTPYLGSNLSSSKETKDHCRDSMLRRTGESCETTSDYSTLAGINIVGSRQDLINFYEGYSSVHERLFLERLNHGPFSWLSLVKKDKYFYWLWDYLDKRTGNGGVLRDLIKKSKEKKISDSSNEEREFEAKALDVEGGSCLKPYDNPVQETSEKIKTQPSTDSSDFSNFTKIRYKFRNDQKSCFDIRINRELQLVETIHHILPNKRATWMLINIFFSYLYPYFPYIDEVDFKTAVINIIGSEDNISEPKINLNVEKKHDLATIGIILIVLRLSFLALFSNLQSFESNKHGSYLSLDEADIRYLSSHPIESDSIILSQMCLDQFQFLRNKNFFIFQLAFLLQVYHIVSPEGDGVDGNEQQVSNGILVQMAYALGLNREPEKFAHVCNDKKVNNLGRKMWYFLRSNDLHNSISSGSSPLLISTYFDTQFPFADKKSANILDFGTEEAICYSFTCIEKYYAPVKSILDLSLNITNKINISEFSSCLSKVELSIKLAFGTMESFLVPFNSDKYLLPAVKAIQFRDYLSLKGFCLSSYLHLFFRYEEDNISVTFFYLKKILATHMMEIISGYLPYMEETEIIFGVASDLILNPIFEYSIHKVNKTNIMLILRINVTIYNMESQQEHEVNLKLDQEYRRRFSSLCKLSVALRKCTERGLLTLSKLSNRYYYAWKVCKVQTHLLKIISDRKIYRDIKRTIKIHKSFPEFSSHQLDVLIEICDLALEKFETSRAHHGLDDLGDPLKQTSPISLIQESPVTTIYGTPSGLTKEDGLSTGDDQIPSIETILSFDKDGLVHDSDDIQWSDFLYKKMEDNFDIFKELKNDSDVSLYANDHFNSNKNEGFRKEADRALNVYGSNLRLREGFELIDLLDESLLDTFMDSY